MFDGTPISARRINHRAPGNMDFVEDEESPEQVVDCFSTSTTGVGDNCISEIKSTPCFLTMLIDKDR